MTTIAYRSGLMASDSSGFLGDIDVGTSRKLFRVGGGLVGFVGLVRDGLAFVEWLRAGADDDDYPRMSEMNAIVVNPGGDLFYFEARVHGAETIRKPYFAIGSGCDVAIGALFAGADAVTAVKAAIRHTGTSKPPVRVLRLRCP